MDDYKIEKVSSKVSDLYAKKSIDSNTGNFKIVDVVGEFDDCELLEDPMTDDIKNSIYNELNSRMDSKSPIFDRIEYFLSEFGPYFAHFLVVQSDLLTKVFQHIECDVETVDFSQITQIISISQEAIMNAFKKGLYVFIIHCIQSDSQILRHLILKLIRKILVGSHLTRVCLFGLGFFDLCLEILPSFSIENLRYLAKTVLRYIILDPVTGRRGYQMNGHSLPSRTDILRFITENFEIHPHNYLRLTNFLKTGCTKRNATVIWQLLDIFITQEDPETHLSALMSYSYMSLVSEENSNIIICNTKVPHAALAFLSSENNRLIFSSFFFLTSSTFRVYREGIVTLYRIFKDLIAVGMDFLQNEDKDIRILSARFLNNIIADCDEDIANYVGQEKWNLFMNILEEDDQSVKSEILWLILNILLAIPFETRMEALNPHIWENFVEFLEGGELPLVEAILNFICVMINEDEAFSFIGTLIENETVQTIQELEESDRSAIVSLSQFIMDAVNDFCNQN
ncbi:hypothetical protein TVAG_449730 [Trichomonas vaginalis G3]|uniref:Uncharacterized protein n=1 Tax=Trichomonas vaginalis (strain ATCC PRA-98 / G3) TaxID=412133 RepID=A2F4B7_TRIV3|nr:armadillo (ARM) repeat-containing protein family [Trichomonas vaginalis G3]EAY00237.1 hypothetical protein TVAG_449730 [Trichomonas vaginalis G3]KAI5536792.1 armadillo (ARM) repeat-containing protein family [Trichomonas vaginalis G3]|eukprot:XP_001313166.1 hypothetical protein [Trichomonas vaginalis G3]